MAMQFKSYGFDNSSSIKEDQCCDIFFTINKAKAKQVLFYGGQFYKNWWYTFDII